MFKFDPDKYPRSPGVYLMMGEGGVILYVGKAKNLRVRLRSYFSASGDSRHHIPFLVRRIRAIDTIVTDTEKEALILENTLIKKHRPRYNIDLRDDKTYLSLRLDTNESFPSLQIVRKVVRDGALYFGPFASSRAVRETLKEIHRIFPLRHYPIETCRRRGRPCLFFQIGQCSAPCHGRIEPEAYDKLVKGATALLSGRQREVISLLQNRMEEAANEMRYEEAARLRDQIRSIEETVERQKVVDPSGGDKDVIGFHWAGGEVEAVVLFIRQGKIVGSRNFPLKWRLDKPELLSAFLQEFYGRDVYIPSKILLPFSPGDEETLAEWLSERRGKRVALQVPRRGKERELVLLAEKNATEKFRERGEKAEELLKVLESIRKRLNLAKTPLRIECFDISNIAGAFTVGSMAVLISGEAAPSAYRRFRVKTVSGSDDYASLREVLRRRLERGFKEEDLPDMILVDGGKGQLAVMEMLLEDLRLSNAIEIAGIAKSRVMANVHGKVVERSEERIFRPGRKNPVVFRRGSPELFLLERLRDEAHRFAIAYHRKLRRKGALSSPLDAVPGVGPARRKALLKHFGSLKRLKEASLEEIEAIPRMPASLAKAIADALKD